ncbi:Transposon TX1 uncharacterized 149 kDa protein [Vitis vinifera]|uniref:Transposon TX1 uncharacterized 149 kDa protein n=1 Tax=Vitis vinifera TaxID=29760 RepID=A0A438JW71_VITVI|nr:Transposon TX1 uncharacterized 149 kDa protein [Vitis vinifera]
MAKKLSDYRPISLITSLYKIIAKVLAGRLRGVLHETIHSTQGAFVQGRQILDAVLIANEIVDEKKRSREEGVVFKIDFEKAYDHVSWDFLDHVMEKKGFNPRWRKWIRGCCPRCLLQSSECADVMSRMLLRAGERNVFEGFQGGVGTGQGCPIYNLQMTPSSSLALEKRITNSQERFASVGRVLDARLLGGLYYTWVFLWVGIPSLVGFWDPVIERISSRLDGWQKAYLSFGGRITLIRSCLTHMPCYFLPCLRFPPPWQEGSALWHQVIFKHLWITLNGWDANTVLDGHIVVLGKAIAQVFQDFSQVYSIRDLGLYLPQDFSQSNLSSLPYPNIWFAFSFPYQVSLEILKSLSKSSPLSGWWLTRRRWVAKAWEEDEGGGSWGLRFNRHLNDWEVGEVESLLSKLHPLTIRRGVEDLFWWKENKNGTFSIKSFYSSFSRDTKPPFPARTIWTPWFQLGLVSLVGRRLGIESQNVMASNFLPVWGAMGDALLCEKTPPRLAWFLCGQEKEESLESCPPLLDVNHLERKK